MALSLCRPWREDLEAIHFNLGHIPFLARWIVPGTVCNASFDVERDALADAQALDLLGTAAPGNDGVPFGAVAGLSGSLVLKAFRGGKRKASVLVAVLGNSDLGIFSDVSDEHCFVEVCHYNTIELIV